MPRIERPEGSRNKVSPIRHDTDKRFESLPDKRFVSLSDIRSGKLYIRNFVFACCAIIGQSGTSKIALQREESAQAAEYGDRHM